MSTSTIVARAKATGHHVLRLDGYTRTRDMVAAGDHITSGDFRVGATTWRIKYYPNGFDKTGLDWIAFALEHDGAATVKARYSFTLLDQAGEPAQTSTGDSEASIFRDKFIKKRDLQSSKHLRDDGFAVRCDIDVMEEQQLDVRVEETFLDDVPESDLRAHLGRLLHAADGADVTFRVGDETLAAHSCVLVARSPVLKADLLINNHADDPLRQQHGQHVALAETIVVDGMDSRAFWALLHFMYTDTLPEMDVEDVPAVARQLVDAADRYQVERLKSVCEDKLSRMRLDTTNTAVVADQQRQDQHHRRHHAGCMGKFVEFLDFLSFPGREQRCSLHSAAAAPVTSTSSSAAAPSASTIIVSEASGYHVLKVEGYSRTRMMLATGEHVSSGEFEVGGRTWRAKYYPNGRTSEYSSCSAYIAIYVHLITGGSADTDEPVHARLKLSLLDHAGEPVPGHTYDSGNCTLTKSNGAEWGHDRFIKNWDLRTSGHLKDDRFAVRCDLTVLVKETRVQPAVTVSPPALPRHLCQLLSSKAGTDVTFEVGGETFAAHRCILAAQSLVFRAELLGTMKERSGAGNTTITIQDMDAAVFRALLHFIYTDELLLPPPVETATAMAQQLFVMADRYDMERLKVVCEDRLCRHLDAGTAATTLALAEQHHCARLKEAVLGFVCSSAANLRGFMASDGYQHLTTSCPSITNDLLAKLAAKPSFSPPTWTYREFPPSVDARISKWTRFLQKRPTTN